MPVRGSALAKLLAWILSDKSTKSIVSKKEKEEENKENNKDV